jgi:hypothetical protein
MSFMDNYYVYIGTGEVKEGRISGKVVFSFDDKGLFIKFNEINKGYDYKKIKRFTVKKKIIDKYVKGSAYAKFASYMVAINKDQRDVGRRIATSQRLAESGRDKIVQEETSIVEFYAGSDFYSIILNESDYPEIRKNLNLACNNPKSFFQKSLENYGTFSTLKKGSKFWWKYWLSVFGVLIGITTIFAPFASSDSIFQALPSIIIILSVIYPLRQKIKASSKSESIIESFKKSKEYNKALKNF